MTTIWLKKDPKLHGLFPYSKHEFEDYAEIPYGKPLRCEIFQPDSPEFRRLYWAIISRIARGMGKDKEDLHAELCIMAGHCHVFLSERYGEVRTPKSVSEKKCDAAAFRKYFDDVIPIITGELGIDREAIADLLRGKRDEERR